MSTFSRTHPRRLTRVAATTFIALGALLGLGVAAATPALAHDELVSYSALDGNDNGIRLSFSNEVLDVGYEILVTGADGTDVADGTPEMSGNDVTQKVKKGLVDGEYTIDWRVVSSDGHPIQGVLKFNVAEGAITTLEPVATDEEAEHTEEHANDDEAAHEHADGEKAAHDHAEESTGGPSTAAVVSISAGAAIIVAGVIAAIVIGSRRRKQAAVTSSEKTPSDTTEHSQQSQD